MFAEAKTVIVVCGPTAVGKTSYALKLAKHFNTKIISADSRQCYKELNIGVAKPCLEELDAVHHYFINSHSIHEEVNAGVYEQYALRSAAEIFSESDVAIMVGGTGLYIKAFAEGIDEIPSVPGTLRQELNDKFHQFGLEWLQQQVQQQDPDFWHVAEQQNPHRLLRALEVKLSTGKSITEYRKGKKVERPFKVIKIGLELPKEQLQTNIDNRVDQMVKDGLLDEVEDLLPFKKVTALQTVGYTELFEYFDQQSTLAGAIERIKIHTRQYAKRQMTWFKKDPEIEWRHPNDFSLNNLVL